MSGEIQVSVGTPIIVSRSKGWHWYPSIRRIRDGSLLLTFSIMADAMPESIITPHHVMVRSTDGGISWYFHRYLYFPLVVAGDAHVCTQLSDRTVIELANNVHTVGEDKLYVPYYKSEDDGKTFSGPYDAPVTLPKGVVETSPAMGRTLANLRFYRSILELDNGDLLASMYGKFRGDTKYRSFVVISKDRGESWAYLSTIAYDPSIGTESFCEPVMALLPSGNILCVMRTGSGEPLYQTISSDGGKTWDKPKPIHGVRGVDPDLTVLSGGVVACSFGRLQPKREIEPSANLYGRLPASMGDQIIFSLDEGRTWTGRTTIYKGPSTGYTGIDEVQPNEIIYAFDTLGYGWHPYNAIRVVRVKVRVVA